MSNTCRLPTHGQLRVDNSKRTCVIKIKETPSPLPHPTPSKKSRERSTGLRQQTENNKDMVNNYITITLTMTVLNTELRYKLLEQIKTRPNYTLSTRNLHTHTHTHTHTCNTIRTTQKQIQAWVDMD